MIPVKLETRDTIKLESFGAFPEHQPMENLIQAAEVALGATTAALDSLGLDYWLTYGSLLGWYRHGSFLPHDDDIDLAVRMPADSAGVEVRLNEAGLRLIQRTTSSAGVVNQKFLSAGGVIIDLFYVRTVKDILIDEYRITGRSIGRASHPETTTRLDLIGSTPVYVPQDAEAYLAHLYGPGWREPVTYWSWIFSPPNATLYVRPESIPWMLAKYGQHLLRALRHRIRGGS